MRGVELAFGVVQRGVAQAGFVGAEGGFFFGNRDGAGFGVLLGLGGQCGPGGGCQQGGEVQLKIVGKRGGLHGVRALVFGFGKDGGCNPGRILRQGHGL